jgi:lipopolysaccharide/colanic/teichoic acid biosynthesis glycosyltransferase
VVATITPAGAVSVARPTPTSALDIVPRSRSEIVCRAMNVIIALIGIVLTAPIMLVVAIAVKLSSRGPAFYTQTRVGLDRRWNSTRAIHERRSQDLGGVPFTIYKFRSMTVDAEAGGQAVWATQNDARVTSVGRVIRKLRLDELPQLFNVVKGDMNIVGPRPERPSIFVRLRDSIEEYPIRQRVKPGITGWAQINHSYDSCLEDVRVKIQFDIQYLQRQSVVEDIKIIAKTIPVMVFRKGGW